MKNFTKKIFYSLINHFMFNSADLTQKLRNIPIKGWQIQNKIKLGLTESKQYNYNIRYLLVLFFGILLVPEIAMASFTQGKPQIVTTLYSNWDLPIVSYDASLPPYNADKTGMVDATSAIQAAINDCAKALGGIVFLPEGQYRINENLTWKEGVTLRGDWQQPTATNKTVKGTILCIYNSKGLPDSISPILLESGTGIRDLSIYYPEQNASAPIAYPYTVRCKGEMQTIMNVTFINSYQAIRYEPDVLSIGFPNVRNVYGTSLFKGIRLSQAAAVPRIINLHFSPDYWAQCGLPNSPTSATILSSMRALPSVGLEIAMSANGIIGNLELAGFDTGLFIGAIADTLAGQSNMKMYDFKISNCKTGINASYYAPQGWSFSLGSIDVDGTGSTAIRQSGGDALIFNSCSFKSADSLIISNSGGITFTNCNFIDWQQTNGISKAGGNICVTGCKFSKTLASNQNNIYLNSTVSGAAISANLYMNSLPKIVSAARSSTKINIDVTSQYSSTDPKLTSYQFASRPFPAKTDNSSIFNVQDYGAKGDITTDNTNAFRAALLAAKNHGGGTVYVPGGAYKVTGNLVIPSGVELRGVHDLPAASGYMKSILLNYVNLSNPGDSAFVSLSQNSGIRGIMFVRPQQRYNERKNLTTIYSLPYLVRALGPNCWCENVVNANADKGIDFASAQGGGYFIDFYLTTPLGMGLNIQTGAAPSVVENMQTNPNFFRAIRNTTDWTVFNSSSVITDSIKYIAPLVAESSLIFPYGTASNISGDGQVSFYSNFYNNTFRGFVINGSPRILSLLSGGEGDNFYNVESSTGNINIKIINNTYHPIGSNATASFCKFNLIPNDSVQIVNTISYGSPDVAYQINNGALLLQSLYQTIALINFVNASGNASVNVEGTYLRGGCTSNHAITDNQAKVSVVGTLSANNYIVTKNVVVMGSSPTGVSVINAIDELKGSSCNIYPNPSNGVFQLSPELIQSLSGQYVVKVFDLNGKAVFQSNNTKNTTEVDVSTLPKGVYTLCLINANKIFMNKVVIY